MNRSESIKNLIKALSNLQGELQTPKNSADNPFFNSKYAPLSEVLSIENRKLMCKHGLAITQCPSGDTGNVLIHSMLMHESGEWIEYDPLTLKTEKPTAQGAGSAITYGRRYSISAILGISSEDDDDGNHASQQNQPKNQPKNQSKNQSNPPTELEKRASAIYFKCNGNKDGQLGWTKEQYASWLKDMKETGRITTEFGKKWTLEDIQYIESNIPQS